MVKRTQSEQEIVNFILKSIRNKSTDDLLNYHEKMGVALGEMLSSGITPDQVESLPIDFIKIQIEADLNLEIQLKDAGLTQEFLEELFGKDSEPVSVPVLDDALKTKLKYGDVSLNEVRDGLLEAKIFDSDLINLGYSHSIVERIKKYVPQPGYHPDVSELPPLRTDATDIYFLGMPGSGKSTMLASLLSFCNRKAILKGSTDNSHGTKYRNQLVKGMAQGFLPDSTIGSFVNFIPVDFRNKASNANHRLNFIDMAGEKFKKVAEGGVSEFNKYKEYLNNKNRKCLIFVLDYFVDHDIVKLLDQDQNLQEVLAYLDDFDILEQTDIIYLVVTKADLFPSENKQEYADKYIDENYTNFLTACQEAKQKYNQIEIKSFPYSIGPTIFSLLLKENNPSLNRNLDEYPKLLADQIIEDSAYSKKAGIKFPWG